MKMRDQGRAFGVIARQNAAPSVGEANVRRIGGALPTAAVPVEGCSVPIGVDSGGLECGNLIQEHHRGGVVRRCLRLAQISIKAGKSECQPKAAKVSFQVRVCFHVIHSFSELLLFKFSFELACAAHRRFKHPMVVASHADA